MLRTRENARYAIGKEEWRWYDLARPQSIDVATKANKLLLQTNALRSEIAVDTMGVLFAGSGTHNAYGLALSNLLDARYCAGLFSADPTNFKVKLISSVFGGGYYSFGDQYIKNLPIPNANPKQHNQIVALVDSLITHAAASRALEKDIATFPDSITAQKRTAGNVPDLDAVAHLLGRNGGLTSEIRWDKKASIEKNLMGEWVLTVPRGKNATTEFMASSETLLRMIAATLEQRGKIARADLLALRIPEREPAQRQYLETLKTWKAELEKTRQEILKLEGQLNDIVYEVFNLTAADRKVIESFLERF